MSVDEIKAAVTGLRGAELYEFAAWVDEFWAADLHRMELGVPVRSDALDRAFGAWSDNRVDFDALRAEADAR